MQISNSPAFFQAKHRATVIFKVSPSKRRRLTYLFSLKKSTDWNSFTPFLSDLYYVWKLHAKRKSVDKNSMKFQFIFPGKFFKKRRKCRLRLSWKYYVRGLHGHLIISLSCKTKYHQKHKIYFPANQRSKIYGYKLFMHIINILEHTVIKALGGVEYTLRHDMTIKCH